MGFRVQCTVGRLVEITIWSPVSLEEAEVWGRQHSAVIDSVPGPYVCFVDLRGAHVFPPDVVRAYVSTMSDEDRLERTATLLPTSAIVAMQIGRMIREAGHPGRQAFDSKDELRGFLEPLLSVEEIHRLGILLRQADYRRGG